MVDSLDEFLNTFDEASGCLQIPLPKFKNDIGCTKSKDNPFAQYYNDIIEHPNVKTRLSFRFGKNTACGLSNKKIDLHRYQFLLTEIVNRCEFHHLYQNRYYVADKREKIDSNYDVQCIRP